MSENGGEKNLRSGWDEALMAISEAKKNGALADYLEKNQRDIIANLGLIFQKNAIKTNFEELMDKIIMVLQEVCGLKKVRIYLVGQKSKDEQVLRLSKFSQNHPTGIQIGLEIPMDNEPDDVVAHLKKNIPIIKEGAEVETLKLKHVRNLEIEKTAYVAIPFWVDGRPSGVICCDGVMPEYLSPTSTRVQIFQDKDTFKNLVGDIETAIETNMVFNQRNQKISQFERIKEFNELIEKEEDGKKLLTSFMEHCIKVVNADGGHLKIYNSNTKRLEKVAAFGTGLAPDTISEKPEQIGFSFKVYEEKEAILVNDLHNNQLFKDHIQYCENQELWIYLDELKKRRSALIVPLRKHTGEVYGVLDFHGLSENMFTEEDKEMLLALGSNVTYALDKVRQLTKRDAQIKNQDKLLLMLQNAMEKSCNLKSVMEIIRDNIKALNVISGIKRSCLLLKESQTGQLTAVSLSCLDKGGLCTHCVEQNNVIQMALTFGEYQLDKKNLAFPIKYENDVLGILYLESEVDLIIDEDAIRLMGIIAQTVAILIEISRDFELKTKQSKAFFDAGKFSTKKTDFQEWFLPVMERVMETVGGNGRNGRNFHLVMMNEISKLIVKASSDLIIDGMSIAVKDKLLNQELDMDKSVSGRIIRTKHSHIVKRRGNQYLIIDVNLNKGETFLKGQEGLPYFEYDPRIKTEIGIPMIIKEGEQEKIIGVSIIDSIYENDFQDLNWEFVETIINFITTAIHNQKLFEERSKILKELTQKDQTTQLSAVLSSFFHDIKNPLSEINSMLNILRMKYPDDETRADVEEASEKSKMLLASFDEYLDNFATTVNKREDCSLKELIQKSLKKVEHMAGLACEPGGNFREIDVQFYCYPDFIDMAFRNIIDNASKYAKQLPAEQRFLTIDVFREKNERGFKMAFTSSTVEEIPEDKLQEIFKPFQRLIPTVSGSGLGLRLVELCMEMHKGKVCVKNVPGGDVRVVQFEITLPKGREFDINTFGEYQ